MIIQMKVKEFKGQFFTLLLQSVGFLAFMIVGPKSFVASVKLLCSTAWVYIVNSNLNTKLKKNIAMQN